MNHIRTNAQFMVIHVKKRRRKKASAQNDGEKSVRCNLAWHQQRGRQISPGGLLLLEEGEEKVLHMPQEQKKP